MTESVVDPGPVQESRTGYDECALCAVPATQWHLDFPASPSGLGGDRIGAREALLTLSNGYLATRGCSPEDVDDGVHYPGTYVAGIYNRLKSLIDGAEREDESLVNLPNWLPITLASATGGILSGPDARLDHDHRRLDMRAGALVRDVFAVDSAGHRTRVHEERIVSMRDPHLAYLRITVTPVNWSGELRVESWIEGDVSNNNVPSFRALEGRHLANVTGDATGDGEAVLEAETSQSRIRIAIASRTEVRNGAVLVPALEAGGTRLRWKAEASERTPVRIEKTVAVFTSRDHAISEPAAAARRELAHALRYADARRFHQAEWRHVWLRMHLETRVHESRQAAALELQRRVNLQLFHVAQTLSRHAADADVGVSARGLHGEGYRGRVFWDELFVLPMLNLRMPELSRSLLMYRYRRLPEARRRAESLGMDGALFPWQSGSDGREETPAMLFNPRSGRWLADRSSLQLHSGLAIAYNAWHYFQVTADLDFLTWKGAELIIEIARFWSSRAEYDAETGRYHLRAMMGPDEFHNGYQDRPGGGIDDNAYVTVMASWVLATAVRAHATLGGDANAGLWQRLRVDAGELERWERISRNLTVPFLRNGLLAQFEGYDELEEFEFDRYRDRYGDIGRLDLILDSEGDTTNRYQVTKQADVLMLFYLFSAEELTALMARLGYAFDPQSIPATIDYYLRRTTYGSTLGAVAHAWVLSRGDRPAAWRLLHDALDADLLDRRGGITREGIHLGAMAASIDILQRCFTGLDIRADELHLHPQLPDPLTSLTCELQYRGHLITLTVTHEITRLTSRSSAARPVAVVIDGRRLRLLSGGSLEIQTPLP